MAKRSQRASTGKKKESFSHSSMNISHIKSDRATKIRPGRDPSKPPVHLLPITNLAQAYDEVPVNGTSAPNIAELIRHTRQVEQQQQGSDMHSPVSTSPKRTPSWRVHSSSSAPAGFSCRPQWNRTAEEDEEAGNYSTSSLGLTGARQLPSKGPSVGSVEKKGSIPSSPLQMIRTPLLGSVGSPPRHYPPPLSTGGSGRGGLNGTNSNVLSINKRTGLSNGNYNTFNSSGSIPDASFSSPTGVNNVLGITWNSSTAGGSGNHHSYPQFPSSAPSNNMNELGIVVGVRIRPFNRREVEELMAEKQRRKHNPSLSASARLASTLNRPKERQPFGPGKEDIAGALHTVNGSGSENLTVTSNGEVVGNPLENCELEILLDDRGHPLPVMEVLSDGRTLVLIDPLKQQGLTPDRSSKFTFDYIYSSFAPSVEIAGMDGTTSGASHFSDTVESSPHSPVSPPLICGLEVDLTPEQEKQAELEQQSIYTTLGLPLIASALEGYNACIFAYGQTSSGKTYTMMGTKKHPGVIPRLCQELFRRVEEIREGHDDAGFMNSIKIDVCYLEIYNEQVRDLLKQRPKNAILHYNSRFDTKDVEYQEYQTLKVRHHPERGVFVEGLTSVTVESWSDCERILRQGNALRTQASTAMNVTSSRSHAIFQLVITQSEGVGAKVRGKQVMNHRVSKVNLVDLSGSERNSKAESMGKHLVEAASINASLSTLRRVLEAIISKKKVVPYRESLLTYVLSDNFGGNSKTVMCANVSPHAVNFSETDSTLRYATIARDVMNKAKVNESPNSRLIRELKDRARTLQEALSNVSSSVGGAADPHVVHSLEGEVRQYQERVHALESERVQLQDQMKEQEEEHQKLIKALRKKKAQEEVWRREAEKQRKQKEKLRQAFRLLVKAHPDMVQSVLFPNEHKEGEPSEIGTSTKGGMGFDEEEEDSDMTEPRNAVQRESTEIPTSLPESYRQHRPRPRKDEGRSSSATLSSPTQSVKSRREGSPPPSGEEGMMDERKEETLGGYSRHSTHYNNTSPTRSRGSRNEGMQGQVFEKRPSSPSARSSSTPPAACAAAITSSRSGEQTNKHLQALRSLQNYQGIGSPLAIGQKSDGSRHSQKLSDSFQKHTTPDGMEEVGPLLPSFLPSSSSSCSIHSSSLPPALPAITPGGDPPFREVSSRSHSFRDAVPAQVSPLILPRKGAELVHAPPFLDNSMHSRGPRSSSLSSSQLRLGRELACEPTQQERMYKRRGSQKPSHKSKKPNGKSVGRNKKGRKYPKATSTDSRETKETRHPPVTHLSFTTS